MKLTTLLAAGALAASVSIAAQPVGETAPVETKPIPVAKATKSGKTLVVPASASAKGTVYYAITDRDRQVFFESDAPVENIKGQSNDVIGYAVVDSTGIVGGEWHLPVKSMKTGIGKRDKHMAGKDWLDAKANPDIIVQVRAIKDAKLLKKTAGVAAYSVTLVADLTLHGVTHTIDIPETAITLLKESEKTLSVSKGDLMSVRSKFELTLGDYGVSHPIIGEKVAKTVSLDISLYLSTMPPEKQ